VFDSITAISLLKEMPISFVIASDVKALKTKRNIRRKYKVVQLKRYYRKSSF